MPTIPTYDEQVALDPGKEPTVNYDTSRYKAEEAYGRSLQQFGSTFEEAADHIEKRQEQQDALKASLGFQGLSQSISSADQAASTSMPADGSGWASSRLTNAKMQTESFLASLPASQREQYSMRANMLLQRQHDAYAQQEIAQQRTHLTNEVNQQAQTTGNALYHDGNKAAYDTAIETANHQIDSLPIGEEDKIQAKLKIQQEFARASLQGEYDRAARGVAAKKYGIVGQGGVYSTPPAHQDQTATDEQQDQATDEEGGGGAAPGAAGSGAAAGAALANDQHDQAWKDKAQDRVQDLDPKDREFWEGYAKQEGITLEEAMMPELRGSTGLVKQGGEADVPLPPRRPAGLGEDSRSAVSYVPVQQGASGSDAYGNIPDVDGSGRAGQKAKFANWNSDPVKNDPQKFAELDPRMQAIVAEARRANPDLHFVIGSGKRTQADEDTAVANGWSPKKYGSGSLGAYKQGFAGQESEHLSGRAADMWALDDNGRITFDREYQDRVTDAMKAAADRLGIPMTAGADFTRPDRPHFQVSADAAMPQGSQGQGGSALPAQPGGAPLPQRRPAALGDGGGRIEITNTPATWRRGAAYDGSDADVVRKGAADLGTSPEALAMVISYESGFRPGIWGGKGGQYLGLIQFSPDNQAKYGVRPGQSFAEQMPAVVAYLKDRGFKPGMSLEDLYSTINAGRPGRYDASDGNGTVMTHVEAMRSSHADRVDKFLGGHGITPGSLGDGTRGDGMRGGGSGSMLGLPNDSRLDVLPWQQRRAMEQQALRIAEQDQSLANSQAIAQHGDFMNTIKVAALDGKYGAADLQRDRDAGNVVTYSDINSVQTIIAKHGKDTADLNNFNTALATPGYAFNPVDKDHRKMVDAGYDAMTKATGDPIASTQRIVERTGIVPTKADTALRGAMIAGDPNRAQAALGVTANMLKVNPNILDALPGGEKLAKQANAYTHFTNDMGMTPKDATARVVEQETPEYKRKVESILKADKIENVVKDNLAYSDLESAFNTGLTYFSRPGVEAQTPGVRRELMGDYEDWFKIHYQESGDVNQAKALALTDLKKVWGITKINNAQTFTRYPVEQAPAYAGIDDVPGKIATAAMAQIRANTKQDVTRDNLRITATADTPDGWRAGKPPSYALGWVDANGHFQMSPQPFVVDAQAMRARVTEQRQRQFEAKRTDVLRSQQNAPAQLGETMSFGP